MNAINVDPIPHFNENIRDDLKLFLHPESKSSNTIVIDLVGQIDTYSSTYFQNQIELVINHGYIKIVFNMAETKFVSAMGLGSFNNIRKSITSHGGNLVLTGIRENVLEVFQISKFINLFSIKENIDSAVSFLYAMEDTDGL